jgi:hypothetical protein
MWSKFANEFGTPCPAALAIDSMVAISTTMLAVVFIFAVSLPPIGSALIG